MTDVKAASSKIAGRSVNLQAVPGHKITPEDVHRAFEQIYRLNGCLACGLLGIDVHVHGGDPEPLFDSPAFNGTVR